VHGPGARLTADDVVPYLGEAGGVAPWELTDAIDEGRTEAALTQLHRMMAGGGRHPLVITATLHTHYTRMLRLDGAQVADEATAARLLGLTGSTFPARKALAQGRRLGPAGIRRAITLLAEADLALKGAIDWPGELVLEVLVARLSRLAPKVRR
jgi:DNA polymerase-3 subunit delta